MEINIGLIRKSFEAIAPHVDEVLEHFYSGLFEQHPEAKDFFATVDMKKQRKALAGGLSFVVKNWENKDKLIPALKSMGDRHRGYGVQDEHYEWVGSSLLRSLEYFLDTYWDEELKDEWANLYKFVAEKMMETAEISNVVDLPSSVPADLSLSAYARDCAKKLLHNALAVESKGSYVSEAREKAREVLKNALDQETNEILNFSDELKKTA